MINGHASLIQIIFEYHITIGNYTKLLDKDKLSLLHFACYNGHSTCLETICELAENHECLNEMLFERLDKYNLFSPLHMACQNGHDACVNYLIDKYNDRVNTMIELEDMEGNRPIHVCAIKNEYDCASLLIDSNCQVNAKNSHGQTAFMLAAYHNSFSIMELFFSDDPHKTENTASSNIKIDIRIDLNEIDKNQNSALHLALLSQQENCALFILDHLETNSKLINLKNKKGDSPLHLASMNGLVTVVEILLSKGADIWAKNVKNKTPLLSCAKNDQVADCLEILISRLMVTFNQKNKSSQSTHNTPSFLMIMGQNASSALSTLRETRNNLNNSINDFKFNENFNKTKNLISESSFGLRTPDIIINDGQINQIPDCSNNTETNEKEKNINLNNLNSTLILNENDILESNVSSTVGSIEGLNMFNLNSTANEEKTKQNDNDNKFNVRISSVESLTSNDSEYF